MGVPAPGVVGQSPASSELGLGQPSRLRREMERGGNKEERALGRGVRGGRRLWQLTVLSASGFGKRLSAAEADQEAERQKILREGCGAWWLVSMDECNTNGLKRNKQRETIFLCLCDGLSFLYYIRVILFILNL